MKTWRTIAAVVAVSGCVACGGNGEEVPALETQAVTPPQATATPERVQGCLRAGESEGTFVLTASATDTNMTAATYQLEAQSQALADLAGQVGRRVEVTGTVVSEQSAEMRGAPMAAGDADDDAPRSAGTSGTPTVQSSTSVEVKRLQVTRVTPVSDDCEI